MHFCSVFISLKNHFKKGSHHYLHFKGYTLINSIRQQSYHGKKNVKFSYWAKVRNSFAAYTDIISPNQKSGINKQILNHCYMIRGWWYQSDTGHKIAVKNNGRVAFSRTRIFYGIVEKKGFIYINMNLNQWKTENPQKTFFLILSVFL